MNQVFFNWQENGEMQYKFSRSRCEIEKFKNKLLNNMEVVKDINKESELGPVKTTPLADEKKVVEEFVSNPENRQRAAELAHQILGSFNNWFTVPRIVKTFKVGTAEAAKQIEMLMLFKMCVGKVEKNIPMFKIDLDHKVQRTLLLEEIAETEANLAILKEKLSTLN